jgi:hypothetical protein
MMTWGEQNMRTYCIFQARGNHTLTTEAEDEYVEEDYPKAM